MPPGVAPHWFTMTASASPPRRLAGVSKVWYLTGAAIPVVIALSLLVIRLPSPQAPVRVPVAAFAVMFYLAEITVVHVRFRRDAHSFSMSEFPLVLSLFFLRPWQILLLALIGSALALAVNVGVKETHDVLESFGHEGEGHV